MTSIPDNDIAIIFAFLVTLDTEVLQFLAEREAQRIQREEMTNPAYSSDSDESIAVCTSCHLGIDNSVL